MPFVFELLAFFCSTGNFLCLFFSTASDLEEWGWIDKNQKGVVKDLIISGNQTLQSALDRFDKGETAELEGWCVLFARFVFAVNSSIPLIF